MAGLSILLVPVVLKHLPESPEYLAHVGQRERLDAVMKQIEPSWSPNTVIALPTPASGKSRIAQLFTHGNALATSLMWVFFIMTMVLSYALNTWLPKLMQNAGFELGPAMWTLVILNAGGLFGSIAGGWIAGRTSYRKSLVGYFALAIVSLVPLSIKPNAFMLNVLLFTAGAAVIGILAIIHAFAVEFYPVHIRSTGVGWATGTGRIGAIAGPILGGALVASGLPLRDEFRAPDYSRSSRRHRSYHRHSAPIQISSHQSRKTRPRTLTDPTTRRPRSATNRHWMEKIGTDSIRSPSLDKQSQRRGFRAHAAGVSASTLAHSRRIRRSPSFAPQTHTCKRRRPFPAAGEAGVRNLTTEAGPSHRLDHTGHRREGVDPQPDPASHSRMGR